MNTIERLALLANLDRYYSLLDKMGVQPSIGYADGASVGLPNIFYVDSGRGFTTNSGRRPNNALATIDAAIGLCTANNGDIIIVLPGHAETIAGANGILADIAGISIIGIGEGASRPTITMSAVASTIAISAASVRIENILVLTTAACTKVFDVTGADAVIKDVEYRRTSGTVAVIGILITTGAARATIDGFKHNTGTEVGHTRSISITAVLDGITIKNCEIFGDFSDACIGSGSAFTDGLIQDCLLTNLQTGDHSIELTAAATGNLVRNLYHNDMTQATGVDPGSMFSFECYHDDVVDTNAILAPVVT